MKATVIVLAGGKNLRLGRNKALEAIDGKSLIERVVERIKPLANRILIVTAQKQSDLMVSDKSEMLVDLYPGKGPLGGIYTGLQASTSAYNIVVACDMPFLNSKLLSYMLELADGFDAVVPRLDERMIEPLHAIYSKSCLGNMKITLEHNRLGVYAFLKTVRVRYVAKVEYQELDPQLLSFFNINYQSDLEKAITLASEGTADGI